MSDDESAPPTEAGRSETYDVETWNDPATGRTVQRLTPAGVACHLPYYTCEALHPDGTLVVCVRRDDDLYPYLLDPGTGEWWPASDVPTHNAYVGVATDDSVTYAAPDGRVGKAPIEGGTFDARFQFPPEMRYSVNVDPEGRYAAAFYREERPPTTKRLADDQHIATGSEGSAWHDRSVLTRLDFDHPDEGDLAKGFPKAHSYNLMHPLISPADPDLLAYSVHKAPGWHSAPRDYFIRYEGGNYWDRWPVFDSEPGIDAVDHQRFLPDGRMLSIWMRFSEADGPAGDPERSYLLVTDPDGAQQAFETPGLVWNHPNGRSDETFVSEGRSDLHLDDPAAAREAYPDDTDWTDGMKDLLTRYDVDGRATDPEPLCVTGTSWTDGQSHPHVTVGRDEQWAYFNSDRNGHLAVYRVRMD